MPNNPILILKNDIHKEEGIDIKSEKDENIPIKNESTDVCFSESVDQMNSLVVKEKKFPNPKRILNIIYDLIILTIILFS